MILVLIVKGSNLRLTLVSYHQIGTVLPDQEERVRIRNENKKGVKSKAPVKAGKE